MGDATTHRVVAFILKIQVATPTQQFPNIFLSRPKSKVRSHQQCHPRAPPPPKHILKNNDNPSLSSRPIPSSAAFLTPHSTMPPQWTRPLNVSVLSTPIAHPPALTSSQFDYEAQFLYPLHDVPTTPSITARVKAAEDRFRRSLSRPHHTPSYHENSHLHPTMPHLPRLLHRSSKTNRPQPILRLNRLHPPLPSDLSSFAPPVRSEFLRISSVASKKYATPPDPVDDHDHSFFEFPSVVMRDQHHPTYSPIQEPRRRNIQHLIERYNNNTQYPRTNTSPPDPRSLNSSTRSPTPSRDADNQQRQFNIRSVRDIFERHTQKLAHHDVSLSSVTDSASPSDASHHRLINRTTTNAPPPSDNRPRRIAFADLSNTLDLSPCASCTSDAHPDDRQVPVVTPPPHSRSPTLYLPERAQRPVGRKKSFAVFRSAKRDHGERARSKSFANGEAYPTPYANQASARRFTNAGRPRKNWVSRHVRAYGGSVRRRFESFRNMISADDF